MCISIYNICINIFIFIYIYIYIYAYEWLIMPVMLDHVCVLEFRYIFFFTFSLARTHTPHIQSLQYDNDFKHTTHFCEASFVQKCRALSAFLL